MHFRDLPLSVLVCLVLAPCLWGGNFVVGDYVAEAVPGLWMNGLRWALAFLCLLPICGPAAWAHRAALWRNLPALALLGGLGVSAFNSVLYVALKFTSVSTAAIAFAVTPFLIIGISALIDRALPKPRILVASIIALGGMLLAQRHALAEGVPPMGVALVLLAALIWAGYCVALQRVRVPMPPQAAFLGQVMMGTVMLAPVALVVSPAPDWSALAPTDWAGLAYLGLGAGALAFWLWQIAISKAGAVRGSLFMNLVPIASVVLGAVVLRDRLGAVELVAFAIVFLGIALSFERARRQPMLRDRSA